MDPTLATLTDALAEARARTLALFHAFGAALPGWEARYAPEIDPPLWLFGHLAWREELWIARNPRRLQGAPGGARAASLLPRADALFDTAQVPPTRRWHLDLPGPAGTLQYLARVRERTLNLRDRTATAADVLAFEDALHERLAHAAQWLALPVDHALHRAGPAPAGEAGSGAMDLEPVTWARYLPFVEAGGYEDDAAWSAEGRAWRRRQGLQRPRHLGRDDEGRWQRAAFGQWRPLEPAEPAMHLSRHEAEAWCRWAGRRLPARDEWLAARAETPGFAWGEVWEWVDGGGLIGASFATAPRLKATPATQEAAPERHDLFAGFRSCAA